MNRIQKIAHVLGVIFLAAILTTCRSTKQFVSNEGFQCIDNGGAITINGWNGNGGDLVIPATINGLPVKVINQAFTDKNLRSVTLPEGITEIEPDAFSGNRLTEITLPQSLTKIGARAFFRNNITRLVIPENLTTIGINAFTNVTTIEAPHQINTKDPMRLPNNFTPWYIVHGRKTGTYVYKNGVWLLDGNPPPSTNDNYPAIIAIGDTKIVSIDGEAAENHLFFHSADGVMFTKETYKCPPGTYKIGLAASSETTHSAAGYCEITLEEGKSYKAGYRGFLAGPNIKLNYYGGGRTVKVTYYIEEENKK